MADIKRGSFNLTNLKTESKKNKNFKKITMYGKKAYLIIFLMIICLSGDALAKVKGLCSNCHTMHHSQTPWPAGWDSGSPNPALLVNDCVGCHSSDNSTTYYDLSGCDVPVVLYTGGSAPNSYLAGGNFWWVKQGLGGDDTKGHNVFLGEDDSLTEAPGNNEGFCGTDSCHINLSEQYSGPDTVFVLNGKYGCEGCHLNVKHHANDHPNGESGLVDSADKGWDRFLSGHGFTGKGVKGYEYKDWEAGHPNLASGGTAHNEYIGDATATGYGFLHGDGVTAFCTGCHGNFCHVGQGSSSPWKMHPSDAVIPNSGEYADAFGANGTGTGPYDPLVPVARTSLPSPDRSKVYIGTDLVQCLSCHRPHGSPYFKLMRWDYKNWPGGGDDKCTVCHTEKD